MRTHLQHLLKEQKVQNCEPKFTFTTLILWLGWAWEIFFFFFFWSLLYFVELCHHKKGRKRAKLPTKFLNWHFYFTKKEAAAQAWDPVSCAARCVNSGRKRQLKGVSPLIWVRDYSNSPSIPYKPVKSRCELHSATGSSFTEMTREPEMWADAVKAVFLYGGVVCAVCVFVPFSRLIMMTWGWFNSCGVFRLKQQTTISMLSSNTWAEVSLLSLSQFNIIYVASLKVKSLSRCSNPQPEPGTAKNSEGNPVSGLATGGFCRGLFITLLGGDKSRSNLRHQHVLQAAFELHNVGEIQLSSVISGFHVIHHFY